MLLIYNPFVVSLNQVFFAIRLRNYLILRSFILMLNSSDAEIAVDGLATPITINMTITRPQVGKIYQCCYWSDAAEEWQSDGIDTVKQSDVLVSCLTNHLTQFTVIGVDPSEITDEPPTETPKG